MRQVPGAKLWIGNADDAANRSAFKAAGIAAVIDLAKSKPMGDSAGEIVYHYVPIVDGQGNPPEVLRHLIDALARSIRGNVPTLVSCSAGMSRSAAIVAAAMAQVQNQDASETLVQVCNACNAEVSAPLWFDIYSATHAGGSFVFKVPPKAKSRASKKEKPP